MAAPLAPLLPGNPSSSVDLASSGDPFSADTRHGSSIVEIRSAPNPYLSPSQEQKPLPLWDKSAAVIQMFESNFDAIMDKMLVLTGKALYQVGRIMIIVGSTRALFVITTTLSTAQFARSSNISTLLFGSVFYTLGRKLAKGENPTEDAIANLFWGAGPWIDFRQIGLFKA